MADHSDTHKPEGRCETLNSLLREAVEDHFAPGPPSKIGVAVSGGGDSVALMALLAECFADRGIEICTVTVDHGLRAGSAAEARSAKAVAANLGLSHDTLLWEAGPGQGNLQDQARSARYDLLTAWAKSKDISVLTLGHTADDQAETVVMRLRRASGVTGLSAMAPRRMRDGLILSRPLLTLRREDLRRYLRGRGLTWVEDPSNEDQKFERVRVREAMETLAPLGLTVDALTAVAENMRRSRDALDWYTFTSAQELMTPEPLGVCIDQRGFRVLPEEISYRLLRHALGWVSGQTYPPRRRAMLEALRAVRHGGSFTVAGCQIFTERGQSWVIRELNALGDQKVMLGEIWDRHWRLTPPLRDMLAKPNAKVARDLKVRALGNAGLSQFSEWRDLDLPRCLLAASPGVWHGEQLIAAPLAGKPDGYRAHNLRKSTEFYSRLLSH